MSYYMIVYNVLVNFKKYYFLLLKLLIHVSYFFIKDVCFTNLFQILMIP